jgi:hypothetical protein
MRAAPVLAIPVIALCAWRGGPLWGFIYVFALMPFVAIPMLTKCKNCGTPIVSSQKLSGRSFIIPLSAVDRCTVCGHDPLVAKNRG